jgi:hypothetical protein
VVVFTLLQALGGLVGFAWLRYGVMYGLGGTALLLGLIIGLVAVYRHRKPEPAAG